MAIVQTYESHLVAVGNPIKKILFDTPGIQIDQMKFLAFAQGFSYQYQKDIKRFKQIGKDDFYFNRQTDWADVSVNITQFDSIDDNYDILKNLNIFPQNETFNSGTYYPFLRNIITGERNSNPFPIYFITDTDERARDILGNENDINRDFTVIDPCYLSSVSWSVAKNTVATFEYSFVANQLQTGSFDYSDNSFTWNHIIESGSGGDFFTISVLGIESVLENSDIIDLDNVSGLFIGGDTIVSGAPNLGQVRGISWSVSIDRSNVQGLGNPMKYNRKISPEHIGQVTIEYNYEGQEFYQENIYDTIYNIRIESKNKNNFFRIFKIENALIESVQLNSSTSGEPDSYSVTLSFKVNKNGGLLYDIQQSESGSTTSNSPELYKIIQLGQDIDGEASADLSGFSVAINSIGDRLIIGSPFNDIGGLYNNAGVFRVYQLINSNWVQLGENIFGSPVQESLTRGRSVSINSTGNRIAISSSSDVIILEFDDTEWNQIGRITTTYTISSISLNSNGDYLIIGIPFSNIAKIYKFNGSTWDQLGSDISGVSGDNTGRSVSINSEGNRIAVSSDYFGGNIGRTRIYEWNGSSWVQLGEDIYGESGDYSGDSISMNSAGNRVVIGAISSDVTRIYELINSNWVQLGEDIDGEARFDLSGISVSINSSGNRVAIGANNNNGNGDNSGHVRIYEWDGLNWNQIGKDIDGEAAFDFSGTSVSMNSHGNRVAIGAIRNDGTTGNSSDNRGHTRVFQINQV